ncbi:MAG: DUF4404 family protein [bacterium]|nr:DUF4404 family protein [bacterium]
MPHKLTEEKLAALRSQLHQHQHSQHLDAGQQQAMSNAVEALEVQLNAQLPPDVAALEELLRAWEAQVAIQHPLLASIVRDVLQKFSSMGI